MSTIPPITTKTDKLLKRATSEKNLIIKKLLLDEIKFYVNISSHNPKLKPIIINRSKSFVV